MMEGSPRLPFGLVLLLVAGAFAGCLGQDGGDDLIGVVVTIGPQGEFARRVGGDLVKVTLLVPEGQDPHTYAPTPRQLVEVAEAELYFMVGSGIEFEEQYADQIKEQNDDLLVVDGSEGIERMEFSVRHDEEEATGLFKEGPWESVEAGTNESDAPVIEGDKMAFNVTLNGGDDNHTGVVNFTSGVNGEYLFFLEHDSQELNFTLVDEEGNEVSPEAFEECDETFRWYGTFDLPEGDHYLRFGPTMKENVTLAILPHVAEPENEHGQEHGSLDPHIWNSPKRAIRMVENLLAGLKQVDPDNTEQYQANARAYIAELEALDLELEEGLADHQNEKFLVFHPAFGYLAHDYGLVQLAIEEDGRAPTPAGLDALIGQAKEEGITVIFVEPQFDSDNARTIADEIDGTVVRIDPLGCDYLNNMRDIKEKLITGLA